MTNAGEWRTPEEMFWYPLAPRQTPRVPPTSGIFDNPTRCVSINVEWWSHISGVIDLLSDPDAWTGTDEEKALAEYQINRLLGEENCMLTDIRVVGCILQKLEDGEWVDVSDLSECGGGGGGGFAAITVDMQSIVLPADVTSSNATYVNVIGFSFTPTRANMIVICNNASLSGSTATTLPEIKLQFNSVNGSEANEVLAAGTNGGAGFEMSVSDVWHNVVIGVAHNINLMMHRNNGSGTCTCSAEAEINFTIIQYDAVDDLFVQDIRISGGELQKKIGGAWLDVTDSLEAILAAINTTATNALTIANTATTINTNQATQISAIQALNTTQNSRLTAIEAVNATQTTNIANHETRLDNIDIINTNQQSRIETLEGRVDSLTAGGFWDWYHDFTIDDYYVGSGGWASGVGWIFNFASPLAISYGLEQIKQNQITDIQLQFVRNTGTPDVEFSFDGATWYLCEFAGAGTLCSTWFRVPNENSGDFFSIRMRSSSADSVYLKLARYLGRGVAIPFD